MGDHPPTRSSDGTPHLPDSSALAGLLDPDAPLTADTANLTELAVVHGYTVAFRVGADLLLASVVAAAAMITTLRHQVLDTAAGAGTAAAA